MKPESIELVNFGAGAVGEDISVVATLNSGFDGYFVNAEKYVGDVSAGMLFSNPPSVEFAAAKKAYDKMVAAYCAEGFSPDVGSGEVLESVGLYFTEGTSDKEYHIQLKEVDGQFAVNFQYGRRGNALTSDTKTDPAVDYPTAKKAYDSLVRRQVVTKGYSYGEAGKAFVSATLAERHTGIYPQLLNEIDEAQAQILLSDPDWGLQEKYDGQRRLSQQLSSQELIGINRTGLATDTPAEVSNHLTAVSQFGPFVLDSELIGNSAYVFDVLEWKGENVRDLPYRGRLEILKELKAALATSSEQAVVVAATAFTTTEKRELYEKLLPIAEGAVFKRLSSAYVPGKPNSGGDQLKRKFWNDATVIVGKVSASRRSVAMHLLNEIGELTFVGSLTIPPNQPIPVEGALLDVIYLYGYRKGSLYQARYNRLRDDIARDACTQNQVKYKGEFKAVKAEAMA